MKQALIVNKNKLKEVKKICKELDLKISVLTLKDINKIDKGTIINLSTTKKITNKKILRELMKNEEITLYNYTNIFNKKSIKELFKNDIKRISNSKSYLHIKGNKIYDHVIEKVVDKFEKFNPKFIFFIVKYKKNNFNETIITGIKGIGKKDINIKLIKKLRDNLCIK